MNKVIAALKRIRLDRILMTILAGVLLFVSTACNNGEVQGTRRPDVPAGLLTEPGQKNPRPEVPNEATVSPFEKGMNDFSDVDPRAEKAKAAAADKAALLKENAERNVIDQTSDVGENTKRILNKKGENVEDLGKNLQQSTEDTKNKAQGAVDEVAKGTKQAVGNVKDSTLNTTRGLTRSANQAAEDVKQTVKANTPDTRDLRRGVDQAASDAKENTEMAGNNLVDNAQQAIENTGQFVQDKLNQVTRGTQRTVDSAARNTLNKTGNAINDAIDID